MRKRKLLAASLMAIFMGGCATPKTWLPNRAQQCEKTVSAENLDSWQALTAASLAQIEESQAKQLPETDVLPVGFDAEVGLIEPDSDGEAAGASFAEGESFAAGESAPHPSNVQGESQGKGVEYFVDLALAGHPSIQAARQRVSAELHRCAQVKALPDPTFNNVFWSFQDNALQTAAGRVANQMSLSQAVPWPQKLQTKAAIVSHQARVAQAEVERIEREVAESVRLAYYEVWFATRAIAVVKDTQRLANDLAKVAEGRYRTGGTQQDVLRAYLEADRLAEQLVSLEKQKRVAQADLAALVGQPVTLLAETNEDLGLANVPAQLDELIAVAQQCNPELKGLACEIQRDRQQHRLACLQKYPDLQFGLNWGLVSDGDNVLSPVANGNDLVNLSVGTTIPIWREKINAGIREAANRTSSTAKRFQAQQDALYGKLRRLSAQADALNQQRDIYQQRIIPRTEATLKLAIADYRGRRTDFFSLIETYRELLMFGTQLARIEASLAGTLAQIQRAVGCE